MAPHADGIPARREQRRPHPTLSPCPTRGVLRGRRAPRKPLPPSPAGPRGTTRRAAACRAMARASVAASTDRRPSASSMSEAVSGTTANPSGASKPVSSTAVRTSPASLCGSAASASAVRRAAPKAIEPTHQSTVVHVPSIGQAPTIHASVPSTAGASSALPQSGGEKFPESGHDAIRDDGKRRNRVGIGRYKSGFRTVPAVAAVRPARIRPRPDDARRRRHRSSCRRRRRERAFRHGRALRSPVRCARHRSARRSLVAVAKQVGQQRDRIVRPAHRHSSVAYRPHQASSVSAIRRCNSI